MLLPDKHVRLAESLIGLASLVLTTLDRPLTFNRLMGQLAPQFETSTWPAFHTAETVSLALCFLHAIGAVDVTDDGDLVRCD
ncbi:MAG: ABC-three component system middle component 6 [Gemmataceae bacterium]